MYRLTLGFWQRLPNFATLVSYLDTKRGCSSLHSCRLGANPMATPTTHKINARKAQDHMEVPRLVGSETAHNRSRCFPPLAAGSKGTFKRFIAAVALHHQLNTTRKVKQVLELCENLLFGGDSFDIVARATVAFLLLGIIRNSLTHSPGR